jgi:hypothetical protein
MVEHIVLIKFRPEVTEAQKKEVAQRLMALQHEIPVIQDIRSGLNFSDRSQGFELGLTVRFEKKEDLAVYGPHPKHQEVVKYMQEVGVENILALDFEV